MGDGGVDRVLGDVALDAVVVVPVAVLGQRPALHLHLVRRLPGAADHLAHPTHRLGVRGDHGEGAEIVQDVFGGDGLAPDARLREGDVFGNGRIKVMAHHEHVEVLVDRVDGVRPGGVRR